MNHSISRLLRSHSALFSKFEKFFFFYYVFVRVLFLFSNSSYLSALNSYPKTGLYRWALHQTGNYPVTCFVLLFLFIFNMRPVMPIMLLKRSFFAATWMPKIDPTCATYFMLFLKAFWKMGTIMLNESYASIMGVSPKTYDAPHEAATGSLSFILSSWISLCAYSQSSTVTNYQKMRVTSGGGSVVVFYGDC